jgi:5-methylcytosine-specific restriction endonuclease McrA
MALGIPKPERAARKAKKLEVKKAHRLTRKQVQQIVYRRERGRCQRCGLAVSYDVHAWKDERAQCNDIVPRSKGGNPLDPDNQELTCRRCHFGGPSGAHAPSAARMRPLSAPRAQRGASNRQGP